MVVVDLILFLAFCVILVLSGSWLVTALTRIASFLRLGEFIVAFILLAFSTSIPELFVGISAALAKNPALSLGNVIGSNIANLTLIAGIVVLFARGIKIKKKEIKKDSLYMFIITLLPIILMMIGQKLSRIDGAILVAAFIFYTWRLLKHKKRYRAEYADKVKKWETVASVFLFVICLVILFGSSQLVVTYASRLAIDLFLPPIFIGMFILAIGTSLPELVASLSAVKKGHSEFMMGNLIGSTIMNSSLILGVTALIYPITANFFLFLTSAFFMILVTFLFATFTESGSRLYWKEGVAMVLLYVFFLIVELNLKGYF